MAPLNAHTNVVYTDYKLLCDRMYFVTAFLIFTVTYVYIANIHIHCDHVTYVIA